MNNSYRSMALRVGKICIMTTGAVGSVDTHGEQGREEWRCTTQILIWCG